MHLIRNAILPILAAAVWISISEFVRNEYLFKSYWISHYEALGLTFPSDPINGAVWGIWSLVFAVVIYVLLQKFPFWQTVLLAWVIGFILMWLVVANLSVLPIGLLYFAVPLSALEVIVAAWIIQVLGKN